MVVPPDPGAPAADLEAAAARSRAKASAARTPAPAPARRAEPQRSFKLADAAVAAILAGVGVLVLVASVRMGIGWGADGPESGFVPFWLAVVMVGCCLASLVRAARRAPDRVFVRRQELGRVLAVLLPAAAMLALTPFAGIYVAGALYMALYMRWAGRYAWAASILLPLAFTVAVFLVFERWFLVPLPKGPLEAWLGY